MDGPSFQYWYGASFVLTVLSFATRADSTPLLLPVGRVVGALRHAISSSCTTSGHVFSGFTALGHDLLAVPFPVTWSTVARGRVVRRCACVSTDHWLYALTVLSFTTAEERQFSPRLVTLTRAQR